MDGTLAGRSTTSALPPHHIHVAPVLCCVVLCCAVLCCVVLCCVVLVGCSVEADSTLLCCVLCCVGQVWVSADGGFNWGLCVAEAQFTDRVWHSTAMDSTGFLYVIGGEEVEHGQNVKQNDVWKSSFAFSTSNKAKITKACGISYPQCSAGLSCFPGSGGTKIDPKTGQVTCTQYTKYKGLGCSFVDPEDPTTWGSSGEDENGVGSTGTTDSGSGMSVGMIALIVVLVLAGVLGIAGYFYYVRKQQSPAQPIIPGLGTDGLLLGAEHSTDSTNEGISGSDYYAQPSTNTA